MNEYTSTISRQSARVVFFPRVVKFAYVALVLHMLEKIYNPVVAINDTYQRQTSYLRVTFWKHDKMHLTSVQAYACVWSNVFIYEFVVMKT